MSKDSSQNPPEDPRQASEDPRQASEDPRQTSEDPRQTSENSAELTSVHLDILDFLWEGEKSTKEIAHYLSVHESTARKHTAILRERRKIIETKRGHYRLCEELAPWTELKNQKIIDALMKMYAKFLERHLQKEDISQNDLKGLILMADRLMKRWYLVHRGYDINTKQAHEDAKQKTAEKQQKKLKNAPLEEQVTKVGHFHESLKTLWDDLPEAEKKKRTV